MASKVLIATLMVAFVALASAQITITGLGSGKSKSVSDSIKANADAWKNFGKDCTCKDTCVDRVKTVCKEIKVDDEDCEDVTKKTPVIVCSTKCLEGKTVVIGLPTIAKGRHLLGKGTGASVSKDGSSGSGSGSGNDGKICKEVCKEDVKEETKKECKPTTKKDLDCKEVKDGQYCEKVCKCNGITTTTTQKPVISVTKGH